MEDLVSMALFAQVVKAGSFTSAARLSGLSKSALSKHVTRLEGHLNARLLNRSTRRLSLTEAGTAFYVHCMRMLAEAEAAKEAVTRLHAEPRGTIKLSAPTTFGLICMAPLLPGFLRRFPEIRVSLTLTEQLVAVIDEGFDLAIRIGTLPDSALQARRLVPYRQVLCASPDYLRQHGMPHSPVELLNHVCFGNSSRGAPQEWHFDDVQGRHHTVPIRGNLQADNSLALREAVLQGGGIGLLPDFAVAADLAAERLIALLPDYRLPRSIVYALYPHNRHLAPKVRAFLDFLHEHLHVGGEATPLPSTSSG